ncbi:hypothetical protein SRABI70_01839 [Pseudomonas sp. Bi70]|nr:hypothetical protein SRABI70_01839 [Pseudomonas sp. Bi70]
MKKVPETKGLVIIDQALMLGLFGRDGVFRAFAALHPMPEVDLIRH